FNQPRDGYSLPPQGAQPQQHHQQQQAPSAQWAGSQPPAQGAAAPAIPNFGFQFPGWPQQPAQAGNASAGAPVPPPGWPNTQGQQAPQAPNGGAFVNPAFFAALMSTMQQNGQSPWGQQQPPNNGNGGQGQ
ncbi:H ACA ribonucleo complex subunit Gar1 Naf1, partial [Fusarium albosuccineum]